MTWQLLPAREHFAAFAAEWDRLNAELYGSHPMFDSRFIGPLLDHFGTGKELLCLHHQNDEINGALIVRPRGFGRWSLFLPAQSQAGAVLMKHARLLESLFPALPGFAWSLDLLAIDPLYAPDWTTFTLPRSVTEHGNTMAVATDGDFARYWQQRPKKLRENQRRYQRRAADAAGPYALVKITEPAEVACALQRYGQIESAGWKAKQGTAIAADNRQGIFYADMLSRFATGGQALVIELHHGRKQLASRLFIRHGRMWVALKTTYDETQSAIAPGRLLLEAVLEQAFAELPEGVVEFYTNASREQADWATSLRPMVHHQLFRNEVLAAALGIGKLEIGPARKPRQSAANPLTVHGYPTIAELPAKALALLDEASKQYPEFAAGWFANLQHSVFGDDPGVRYYVAERAGRPVALLPVRLARYGLVKRVEALGNYYTTLYAPVLAPDATETDLAALLSTASKDHGHASEMRFAPMAQDSAQFSFLITALRSIGWLPFRYFCFGNWYLEAPEDHATYLKMRSGSLRSTIKRMQKKFAADGGTLEIITLPEQCERGIAAYNQVYAESWKQQEPYPEFIPGLARWHAENGGLRLGIAWLNGQPIAAQMWFVSHGKAHIYKVAYDEQYSSYSPGTIVSNLLMAHVIDLDKVAEVDFLVGDDKYKQIWMSHRRERWGIVAYNPKTIKGIAMSLRETIGKVIKHPPA